MNAGRRAILIRLGLAAGGVLAALLLLEGTARLVLREEYRHGLTGNHPLLRLTGQGPRLLPEFHQPWFSPLNRRTVQIDTNRDGFREREFNHAAPRSGLLVLGDSIAFGPGLEERETWPRRLEAELGGTMRVVNTGVPDLGTREELTVLQTVGPQVRPRLVLLAYYLNDPLLPYIFSEAYGRLSPWLSSRMTGAREHSYLFRWMWDRLQATRYLKAFPRDSVVWPALFNGGEWRTDPKVFGQLIAAAKTDFGVAWTEAGWTELPGLLGRLRETAAGQGAELAVVIFPVSIQVESVVFDDRPQQRLGQICGRMSLPCFDLLPPLRERRGETLFYDQCHLTSEGAALAARLTAEFLRQEKLVPPGP